ncbi:unnamed protein product [Moneuplotes crassus]|uniref:Uncharacterized protein n=2 Tax=Euplotes crassus TaxID=5936 RepID=A0AAD1XSB4_EUPCR|nr:unnamed protein product [Moneuplotes crassus]
MKSISLHKRLSRKSKTGDLSKLRTPKIRIKSTRPNTRKCVRIQTLDFAAMSPKQTTSGDNSQYQFQNHQDKISNSIFYSTPKHRQRKLTPKRNTSSEFLPFVSISSEKTKRWERISKVIEKEFTNQQEKVRLGYRQFQKYKRMEKRNLPFLNTKYYNGISTLVV